MAEVTNKWPILDVSFRTLQKGPEQPEANVLASAIGQATQRCASPSNHLPSPPLPHTCHGEFCLWVPRGLAACIKCLRDHPPESGLRALTLPVHPTSLFGKQKQTAYHQAAPFLKPTLETSFSNCPSPTTGQWHSAVEKDGALARSERC